VDEWGQKSANTTNYWKHAVLSVASRDRNYILAATPIKNEKEVADALNYCDRGCTKGMS